MKIKRVKLLDGGFRGAEIEYHKLEKKGGRLFNNKTKDTLRFPIHLGMENKFRELRPFWLEICKLLDGSEEKDIKDFKIAESETLSVEVLEDGGFVLVGESVVFSNKRVTYKTPKVYPDDNYHNYDAVMLIIKELIEEVKVYMEGTAKPSDEEVLIRWVERHENSGVDLDTIKGMSPEEQKKKLTELLEKAGAVVMWNEEMEVDEEVLSEGLEKMKNEIEEEVVVTEEKEEDVTFNPLIKGEEETSFTLPAVGDELTLEPIKEPVKAKK
jgi:hypothetical protein